MRKREIHKRALKVWGPILQRDKTIEEMAELTVALMNGDSEMIKEEIVDAIIMIEQMRFIVFDSNREYNNLRWKKLRRVEKRILKDEDDLFVALKRRDNEKGND